MSRASTKQLLHKHVSLFGSRRGCREELWRSCNELRRTCRNLESPNVDLRGKKGNAYSHRASTEGRRRFSGLIPVDAAAEVDGGERLSGGGGARAAAEVARGGRQRREKNEKIGACLFIRG